MKNKLNFIDIGLNGEQLLLKTEILGIFDLDKAQTSRELNEFLRQNSGKIVTAQNFELPKSFVLTTNALYLSPLSSETLQKRFQE